VKRRSLNNMPVIDWNISHNNREAQYLPNGESSKWQPKRYVRVARRSTTLLAWKAAVRDHKHASTLAGGMLQATIVFHYSVGRRPSNFGPTTETSCRALSVGKADGVLAKIAASVFYCGSEDPVCRSFSCKASESQPRGALLLMNAWTIREFALLCPHPPK